MFKNKQTFRLLPVLLISFLLFACDKNDSITNQDNANANISANPVAYRTEIPRLQAGPMDLFISHSTQVDGNDVVTFSLEYDCSLKHARWVAFSFYDVTAKTGSGRTDAWGDDPKVPVKYRSTRSDFFGYDRGHICASYDRQYSKEGNEQTFYYSNMSPQLADFNQKIWQQLEAKVQGWGRNPAMRDTLYVVKGGTIRDDQVLAYNGYGKTVPVPKYFYMALLCVKGGYFKAIAFWLEHKKYNTPYDFSQYAISIDELEERTGIDFFCNLPDEAENKIEAKCNYNDWP